MIFAYIGKKKKDIEPWNFYNKELTQKMMDKMNNSTFPDTHHQRLLAKHPKILFKWDWNAKNATHEEVMYMPQSTVLMRQTGTAECKNRDECLDILYPLQDRDMQERGLPDLQYNFYLGSDGVVYEGRGWHVVSTKDPGFEHLNGKSFDIAYIGDFTDKEIPKKLVKVRDKFLWYLHNQGYLPEEYSIIHLGTTEPVAGVNYLPEDTRWDPNFRYTGGDEDMYIKV